MPAPIYDPSSSLLRLRRLQRLTIEAQVDALVLVAGVDANDDVASRQALCWLLLGTSGREVLDVARLPLSLEGVVVCVYPDGVALHVTRAGYDAIAAHTFGGLWDGTHVFCPSTEVEEDPDAAEEFKVASFVQMLAGRDRLGFAIGATRKGKKGHGDEGTTPNALHDVELWPLVQAYGLEGVGRPGFLSMSHSLVDTSQLLRDVCYAELDARAVDVLARDGCMLLGKHMRELFNVLDMKTPADREHLTEKQVGEPMVSYFAYGSLRPPPECARLLTMGPRCAAGVRTNSDAETTQSDSTSLSMLGADGQRALHLVLEAADPRSPVRCARTVFLASSSIALAAAAHGLLSAEAAEEALEEAGEADAEVDSARTYGADELILLMRLYCALRDACRAAISHFVAASDSTARSAKHVALEALVQGAGARGLDITGGTEEGIAALRSRVKFALWAGDHANNAYPSPAPGARKVKVCRIALQDVTSLDGTSLLGGLVYADSFVDRDGHMSVVTEHIPLFTSYLQRGGEEFLDRQVGRRIKAIASMRKPSSTQKDRANLGGANSEEISGGKRDTLGRALFDGSEPCALWCGGGLSLPVALQGQLIAFRHGLAFFDCPHHAPILLRLSDAERSVSEGLSCRILAIQMCGIGPVDASGNAPDPRDRYGPYLAIHVEQPPYADLGAAPVVYLPMGSFSKSAQRILQREVLPAWREACQHLEIPYGVVDYSDMPESFADMSPLLKQAMAANEDESEGALLADDRVLAALDAAESDEVRSASPQTNPSESIAILEQRMLASVESGEWPAIRIVPLFGLPGSHHESVAASIVRYAGSSAHVHVSFYPFDAPLCPDRTTVSKMLFDAVTVFTESDSAPDDKQRYALLCLPSYADVACLYNLVCTEAEASHPGVFMIHGGITVVHTDAGTENHAAFRRGIFMRHRGFVPGALEHLNSAFVRAVVSIEPAASASGARATSRPFSARPSSARPSGRTTTASNKASDGGSLDGGSMALLSDVNDAISWCGGAKRLIVRCVFSGASPCGLLAANVADAWQELLSSTRIVSTKERLPWGFKPGIGRWLSDPRFEPSIFRVRASGDVDSAALCHELGKLSVTTAKEGSDFNTGPLYALGLGLEESARAEKIVLDVHGYLRHRDSDTPILQITGSGTDVTVVPCGWWGELALCKSRSGLPALIEEPTLGKGLASDHGVDLVVRCLGLQPEEVQRAVLAAGITPPSLLNEGLSAKDLSPEEVAYVKKHVVVDASRFPLPEDVYFDGVRYLDCFGDALKEHPRLGDALEAYAEEKNQKAREANLEARCAGDRISALRIV